MSRWCNFLHVRIICFMADISFPQWMNKVVLYLVSYFDLLFQILGINKPFFLTGGEGEGGKLKNLFFSTLSEPTKLKTSQSFKGTEQFFLSF